MAGLLHTPILSIKIQFCISCCSEILTVSHFVILKESGETRDRDNLSKEINQHISDHIGPIAKLDKIQFVSGLPKTRSGKIMRRILRKIAEGDFSNFGDITTLLNPEIVDEIKDGKI